MASPMSCTKNGAGRILRAAPTLQMSRQIHKIESTVPIMFFLVTCFMFTCHHGKVSIYQLSKARAKNATNNQGK